jgi:hypothetical protein
MKESACSFLLGILLTSPFYGLFGKMDLRLVFVLTYNWYRLSIFMGSLGLYHWAEYLYVCLFQYPTLKFDSKQIKQLILNRIFDIS